MTGAYTAVISDMDGVLTRTADLHQQAWQRVFDKVLARVAASGETAAPAPSFSGADYRAHVDGKPRYDGVADFLSSRGIELPRGTPTDPPDAITVCGIGNRKDILFKALLDEAGVRVFDDAVAALARWRRGGLKVAIVSGSRNCHEVLRAAGLEDGADAIVEGRLADVLGLDGKRGIMLEAARRLGVKPDRAVVLEDATAGARAARSAGFGRIIGVSRNDHRAQLLEAGADEVVDDVFRTAFPRRLPCALDSFDALAAWAGGRAPAIFLDYDGTLTPIVDDPAAARLPETTRAALVELLRRWPVAIISGRDRRDVTSRADVPGLLYAGNHGFDIEGGGREHTLPEAEAAVADVRAAEARLREELADRPGVIIESKRFSVGIHYRQVRDADVVEFVKARVHAAREGTRLRVRTGKMVLELEPDVPWNKGRALTWLMEVMNVHADRYFPLYIGDDDTDEDAFAVLPEGAGILVGPEVATTLADYRLADPNEVRTFLQRLKTLPTT